jgi:hypothetical protein
MIHGPSRAGDCPCRLFVQSLVWAFTELSAPLLPCYYFGDGPAEIRRSWMIMRCIRGLLGRAEEAAGTC